MKQQRQSELESFAVEATTVEKVMPEEFAEEVQYTLAVGGVD